jgi:hypothetical protein
VFIATPDVAPGLGVADLCEMNKTEEVLRILHAKVSSFRCIFVVDSGYLSRAWCIQEIVFSRQIGIAVEGMVKDYNGERLQWVDFDVRELVGIRREDVEYVLSRVPDMDELLCKAFGWV